MAEDKIAILGRWQVSFKKWKWEYLFTANGVVRWRDPLNNENGVGRWALTGQTVYIAWTASKTKESWTRPIKQKGQTGWIDASYGVGSFSAEKIIDVVLPAAQSASGEIDFELDPVTGEYVATDGKSHSKYIERIFLAVAYGLDPDGYYIYCAGIDLPIHAPESMVDFGLATAASESGKIYDSFAEAKTAANDSPGQRRIAYFWGAGGAVVSPTIIGPATTPGLYSTIVEVRNLRNRFLEVVVPWITMAIGMIGGPKPMVAKSSPRSRIAAKRGGNVPARAQGPSRGLPKAVLRPRASRAQLQNVVSNPMEYMTFRTRNEQVASSKALQFTGETNPSAPSGIYCGRGTGHKGYGPYGVSIKADKVSVRPVAGRADEFVITSPIDVEDGIWWHESDLVGIKK